MYVANEDFEGEQIFLYTVFISLFTSPFTIFRMQVNCAKQQVFRSGFIYFRGKPES